MEDNKKLLQYLQILGFSLTLLFCLGQISCKDNYHGIAEYSFHNRLDSTVELFLYVSNENYKTQIPPYSLLHKGDSVKLLMKESFDRDLGGFGENYFHKLVDSAKVKIHGHEQYIAVWRQNGENNYAEGYESLWDFYNDWPKYRQHRGSHAEYIYILQLEE